MRFWDASAVVPLIIPEVESEACRKLFAQDPEMMVWSLTATEVLSALFRRHRGGQLDDESLAEARQRLELFTKIWHEIVHLEEVRRLAHRVLALHPLRAADALQLAAALVAAQGHAEQEAFVCLDRQLAQAASKEGFQIVTA